MYVYACTHTHTHTQPTLYNTITTCMCMHVCMYTHTQTQPTLTYNSITHSHTHTHVHFQPSTHTSAHDNHIHSHRYIRIIHPQTTAYTYFWYNAYTTKKHAHMPCTSPHRHTLHSIPAMNINMITLHKKRFPSPKSEKDMGLWIILFSFRFFGWLAHAMEKKILFHNRQKDRARGVEEYLWSHLVELQGLFLEIYVVAHCLGQLLLRSRWHLPCMCTFHVSTNVTFSGEPQPLLGPTSRRVAVSAVALMVWRAWWLGQRC